MYRSSHTPGFIHASSCSADIQVPPSHSAFHFLVVFLHPFFFSVLLNNLCPSPCPLVPSCGILSRLRRMDPGAVPAQYSQLLDCMCSWGQATDILELITDWLTEALPKQGVSQHNSERAFIWTKKTYCFFPC